MLESYRLLRQDFLSIAEPLVDSDALDQLKRNYAFEIDSKRKLSQIKDLKAFIRLLEKRDIMSYRNIEPLWYISKKYIHKPDLDSKLEDYENWLKTVPLISSYDMYQSDKILVSSSTSESTGSESIYNSIHNLSQSSGCSVKSFSNSTHTLHCNSEQYNHYKRKNILQETVLLQVKDKLGRSWRDVARHLGIRECEIDAVQSKYPYDLKEQSYEILKIYMSQSDTEQWAINLMRALEKGRRKDLRELVEELILKDRNM